MIEHNNNCVALITDPRSRHFGKACDIRAFDREHGIVAAYHERGSFSVYDGRDETPIAIPECVVMRRDDPQREAITERVRAARPLLLELNRVVKSSSLPDTVRIAARTEFRTICGLTAAKAATA